MAGLLTAMPPAVCDESSALDACALLHATTLHAVRAARHRADRFAAGLDRMAMTLTFVTAMALCTASTAAANNIPALTEIEGWGEAIAAEIDGMEKDIHAILQLATQGAQAVSSLQRPGADRPQHSARPCFRPAHPSWC